MCGKYCFKTTDGYKHNLLIIITGTFNAIHCLIDLEYNTEQPTRFYLLNK